MPIYKGDIKTESAYKGDIQLARIYKGSSLVYENYQTLTAEGIPPITLTNCKNTNALGYKVYGNSEQDGTPTPTNPIEVESVGDKTANLLNMDGLTVSELATTYLDISNSNNIINFEVIRVGANGSAYGYEEKYSVPADMIGQTMSISANISQNGNTKCIIMVDAYLGSSYVSRPVILDVNTQSATFTVPSGIDSLVIKPIMSFRATSAIGDTGTISNIMLNNGSLQPYEHYGYEIPITVSGLNTFNPNGTQEVVTYNAIRFGESGKRYAISLTDKDTSVDISGCYLAVSDGAQYSGHTIYFSYFVQNGEVQVTKRVSSIDYNQYYLVVYPATSETWNKINARFNIMVVEGTTYKDYEPYYTPSTTNIYLDEPLRKIGNAMAVPLPVGYTQVEYLQTTSTQYIDTGYIPDGDEVVDITFDLITRPTSGKYVMLFGERMVASPSDKGNYWLGIAADGSMYARFGTVGLDPSLLPTFNEGRTYTVRVDAKNRMLYITGATTSSFSFAGSDIADITRSLYLGALNASSTLNLNGVWNYRSFKITKNGNVVCDLVSAKNGSNVAGFYDLATNTFRENDGTGTFGLGNSVSADYIDFENQKVYRNIFAGNLSNYTFYSYNAHPSTDAYSIFYNYEDFNMTNSSDIICSHFIKADYNLTGSNHITLVPSSSRAYIGIDSSIVPVSDSTAMNNWLSTNKPEFYCIATTPTEETVTLPNILLNKGTNIVNVTTDLIPSNVWIKYKGKQ